MEPLCKCPKSESLGFRRLLFLSFFPESSDEEANEPMPSTSSNFNVDEFISNVFDKNKFKSKNPFYLDSDTSDEDESDTTETTTSNDIAVPSAMSSANEDTNNK